MRFADIEVGKEYGLRLRLAVGTPLLHVLVLDKVARNKQVKVRHLDEATAGMEEFLPFNRVQVLWSDRRRFLKDEEQLARVRELSAGVDFPLIDAVQFVLDTSGEVGFGMHSDGHLSANLEPLLRVARRAGLEPVVSALDPSGFVDRQGQAQLPYRGAERLARAFAATEPDTVTMAVSAYEEEHRAKGYEIGERFWHEYLQKDRPMLALARQWAGFDTELERLSREIERLRNVVSIAVTELERAGLVAEARRVQRARDDQ